MSIHVLSCFLNSSSSCLPSSSFSFSSSSFPLLLLLTGHHLQVTAPATNSLQNILPFLALLSISLHIPIPILAPRHSCLPPVTTSSLPNSTTLLRRVFFYHIFVHENKNASHVREMKNVTRERRKYLSALSIK